MKNIFWDNLINDFNNGIIHGVYSCCSSNYYAIKAVIMRARQRGGEYVLIESTANQVNQFGGYSGMRPAEFRDHVYSIAEELSFPKEKIILGGDHLGPLVWKSMDEKSAMSLAKELIEQYVSAGFSKIHIDTSMQLADDKVNLTDEIIARRGVELCKAAEGAWKKCRLDTKPVYVVGSEVPIPGGAQDEEGMVITKPINCMATINSFYNEFVANQLLETWERVIAIVVQPGVEFGLLSVTDYDHKAANSLMKVLREMKGICFEGHSTDYQTKEHLREMVRDGVLILKVGPALTFTLREGIYLFEQIEKEIVKEEEKRSNYRKVLEKVMVDDPVNWRNHYYERGIKNQFVMSFSYSDRQRYYLQKESVEKAFNTLKHNLEIAEIPLVLLSQFFNTQYKRIRKQIINNTFEEILLDYIGTACIDDYTFATTEQ